MRSSTLTNEKEAVIDKMSITASYWPPKINENLEEILLKEFVKKL